MVERLRQHVVRAQRGDLEAFGHAVRATQRMAFAVARSVLWDPALAQDAVQDAKAYRICQVDATHLDAFHQAEVFCMDDVGRLDPWRETGRVLQSLDRLLPGRAVKLVPTEYPMCSQAWDLQVEDQGHWLEVMACGVFTDAIVAHLGGIPGRHMAFGAGCGLERLAMIRYGIDDIRKIEVSRVA